MGHLPSRPCAANRRGVAQAAQRAIHEAFAHQSTGLVIIMARDVVDSPHG